MPTGVLVFAMIMHRTCSSRCMEGSRQAGRSFLGGEDVNYITLTIVNRNAKADGPAQRDASLLLLHPHACPSRPRTLCDDITDTPDVVGVTRQLGYTPHD